MDPIVFGLLAAAAIVNVAWNVLLKTSGDPLRAGTLGMATGALVIVPVAIAGWLVSGGEAVPTQAIVLGVASGILEATYFVLLAGAYERGDLSIVYPIARGTAPLLAVLTGVVVLGETIRPGAAAGIALLLAGILALQRPWRILGRIARRGASDGAVARSVPERRADQAIVLAFLTGLVIVAYSAVDRVGVRLVPPWLYAAVFWPVTVFALLAWGRLVRRGPVLPMPGSRVRAGIGGLMILTAYLLVLGAYTVAPLAIVAPLRESAVVLAAAWGAVRMREAADRREAMVRVGAAALVLAGAVLIALEA